MESTAWSTGSDVWAAVDWAVVMPLCWDSAGVFMVIV